MEASCRLQGTSPTAAVGNKTMPNLASGDGMSKGILGIGDSTPKRFQPAEKGAATQ